MFSFPCYIWWYNRFTWPQASDVYSSNHLNHWLVSLILGIYITSLPLCNLTAYNPVVIKGGHLYGTKVHKYIKFTIKSNCSWICIMECKMYGYLVGWSHFFNLLMCIICEYIFACWVHVQYILIYLFCTVWCLW